MALWEEPFRGAVSASLFNAGSAFHQCDLSMRFGIREAKLCLADDPSLPPAVSILLAWKQEKVGSGCVVLQLCHGDGGRAKAETKEAPTGRVEGATVEEGMFRVGTRARQW
jgi:hypothetical protein